MGLTKKLQSIDYFTFILSFVILLVTSSISAQDNRIISGRVIDSARQKPLSDVAVYLNGTTFGTLTDHEGYFSLKSPLDLQVKLVISYLGYKPVQKHLPTQQDTVDFGHIYLEEGQDLKPVHITADHWSREKKLNFFRRWFLGKVDGKDCHIKNEEVLRLRFDPETKKLSAYADRPLQIENDYLDYELRYQLKDFILEFAILNKRNIRKDTTVTQLIPNYVFYNGQSFFKERHDRVKRRYRKRRMEVYKGSRLQFMRALATKTLKEQGYKIYHNHFQYPTYHFFNIDRVNDLSKITVTAQRISILYDDKRQTDVLTRGKSTVFYIDKFGNYAPSNAFFFKGDMSRYRVAKMLPLDYEFPDK